VKTAIPTETMVITDKAGGGCTMLVTHTASACTEVETFEAIVVSGSSYDEPPRHLVVQSGVVHV
jgi:hypothetical protein